MINAALLDVNRIITNVVVLESLDQRPGAVECPLWCGIGMSIDAPEPAPAKQVPQAVTMRQARTALSRSGLLAEVNAAVSAADEETRIAWEFSTEVQRDFPLVSTLAAALNLSEQQLDDIFTLAATL